MRNHSFIDSDPLEWPTLSDVLAVVGQTAHTFLLPKRVFVNAAHYTGYAELVGFDSLIADLRDLEEQPIEAGIEHVHIYPPAKEMSVEQARSVVKLANAATK